MCLCECVRTHCEGMVSPLGMAESMMCLATSVVDDIQNDIAAEFLQIPNLFRGLQITKYLK